MKVIHSLPGRLRIDAPEVYYQPVLAGQVTKNLACLKGFLQVDANPRTGRVLIKYAPDQLSVSNVVHEVRTVVKALQSKKPLPWGDKRKKASNYKKELEVFELESLPLGQQVLLTLFSGLLFSYVTVKGRSSKGSKDLKTLDQVNDFLTLLTGYPIFRTALEHLFKNGSSTTELLATAASLASLTLEEKRWGLFINTVVYLNTLIRTAAAEYSRDKIRVMLEGRQNAARVVTSEGQVILKAENLVPGSTIVVRAGERLPGDGTIKEGRAVIHEHPARGKNWGKAVSAGDRIYAGSVLQRGEISVRVTRVGVDTYVGRTIRILQQGTYRCREVHELTYGVASKMSMAAFAAAIGIYLKTKDLNRFLQLLIVGAPGAAGFAASMAHGTSVLHAVLHGIFAKDDRYIEQMGQADTILFDKPDYLFSHKDRAEETIELLREGQARRIGILADCSSKEADKVAESLKLDHCWADSSPEMKSKIIRSLQKQGRKVAVIGDEKNDLVALTTANVGIALKRGDELNFESAGIIVPGEDPRLVGWLKLLSSRSQKIARQNMTLSFGTYALGLTLGLLGRLSPLTTIIINNVSTLGILANSGRLLMPIPSKTAVRRLKAEAAAGLETEPPGKISCLPVPVPGNGALVPSLTQDILKHLEVDPQTGLGNSEVEKRLKIFGPNVLPCRPLPSIAGVFLSTLTENYMSKVLLGLGGLSLLIDRQANAVMSVGVLLVNTTVAVVQERRTQHSLAMLDGFVAQKAWVIRKKQNMEVKACDLVPGDIVFIQAGDTVPADAHLLDSQQLVVEEAPLTGESVPVLKDRHSDKASTVYMGTRVMSGRAGAVVTKTGVYTEIGRISQSIDRMSGDKSPFNKRLDELYLTLVNSGLVISFASFLAGLIHRESLGNIIEKATSLAVSFIPDGLAPIITMATAFGGLRLIKKQVAVRELTAMDTLGCTSVICCDKTGTLTQNHMEVQDVFMLGKYIEEEGDQEAFLYHESYEQLFRAASVCNNVVVQKGDSALRNRVKGDSLEVALILAAEKAGLNFEEEINKYTRLRELPFSSETMYMAVEVQDLQGKHWSYVKGAPDVILNQCTKVLRNGSIVRQNNLAQREFSKVVNKMSNNALRVIGIAYKPLEQNETLDQDLIMLGLVGILDPPRQEAPKFVKDCRRAGIKVLMITGDHQNTALAIAKKLGIADKGAEALTGTELDKMGSHELRQAVRKVQVYARTSPRHKQMLVKVLKDQGLVVSMVGDGVNDVPALKEADLGIAMGITGTNVAKETASIILNGDNIAELSEAVKEGRNVYSNIRRTMRYMITTNFGDGVVILFSSLLGNPLPITPLQLLWVNITSDPYVSWTLAGTPPNPDVLRTKPRKEDESIFANGLGRRIGTRSLLIGLSAYMAFNRSLASGESLPKIQTKTMAILTLGRLLHLLDYRSQSRGVKKEKVNKKIINGGIIMAGSILGAAYVSDLSRRLNTEPLSRQDWVHLLGNAGLVMFVDHALNRIIDYRLRPVVRF